MDIIDEKIKKKCKKMILTGGVIAILSLIGLIVFAVTGLYLIHPAINILMWLIGNGWAITGCACAWENFDRENK